MPKQKPVKTRNAGTLTEAAYFSLIRSVLRLGIKRCWIPMQQALELSKRPSQSSNKRLKWEYECAHCHNWFPHKEVRIDHVIPCGSLLCYNDIAPFIERMTAENPEDYQILCTTCHQVKTNEERAEKKLLKQQHDKESN